MEISGKIPWRLVSGSAAAVSFVMMKMPSVATGVESMHEYGPRKRGNRQAGFTLTDSNSGSTQVISTRLCMLSSKIDTTTMHA